MTKQNKKLFSKNNNNNKHNFFIVEDLIGRLASFFSPEQIQYHWLKQHLLPNLDNEIGMVGVGHLPARPAGHILV